MRHRIRRMVDRSADIVLLDMRISLQQIGFGGAFAQLARDQFDGQADAWGTFLA